MSQPTEPICHDTNVKSHKPFYIHFDHKYWMDVILQLIHNIQNNYISMLTCTGGIIESQLYHWFLMHHYLIYTQNKQSTHGEFDYDEKLSNKFISFTNNLITEKILQQIYDILSKIMDINAIKISLPDYKFIYRIIDTIMADFYSDEWFIEYSDNMHDFWLVKTQYKYKMYLLNENDLKYKVLIKLPTKLDLHINMDYISNLAAELSDESFYYENDLDINEQNLLQEMFDQLSSSRTIHSRFIDYCYPVTNTFLEYSKKYKINIQSISSLKPKIIWYNIMIPYDKLTCDLIFTHNIKIKSAMQTVDNVE